MTATIFRTLVVFGVAAVTASATVSASPAIATARTPVKASVTGSAQVFYTPAPDDDVRFTFDAHTVSPTADQSPRPADAQGAVRVSHWVAAENLAVWAEGEVNCVMTSGRAATLTALVTKTSPKLESWMGKHIGFTVFDGGADRPGRSFDQVGFTGPVENLAKCMAENPDAPVMAPAPFFTLQSGGYRVKPA
jgi:hypothetical protein